MDTPIEAQSTNSVPLLDGYNYIAFACSSNSTCESVSGA